MELGSENFLTIVQSLEQAGKVVRADDHECHTIEIKLRKDNSCRSNDQHVLGLMVATRCETIFTHDQDLHVDLKNADLVPHRPSIYQNARHSHLLQGCSCR